MNSVNRLFRRIMLLLVRLYGFAGAQKAAKTQEPVPTAPRILLIRPDHLGDMALTTPVLDALKTYLPQAHITMMVGPWSSEVVARHPAIDRLLTCPFPGFQRAPQKPLTPYTMLFSFVQQLRRSNYDIAINLRPDFWWGSALIYLAHIPRRVGYAIAPGTPFLNHAVPFHAPELATVSNLRLASVSLEILGHAPLAEPFTPAQYPLVFTPTPEEYASIRQRLHKEGITDDTPIVVIHPGTGAAVKLWRNEAWAHCANALPTLLTTPAQVRIMLTGSANECPMLEEIAREMPIPPVMLTDLTVGQLAALLGQAILVLGVDNGPLHLAVAQGTPTIQIFGPTDPHVFGPWGNPEQHIVIASTHRCPTCPVIPCGRLDFRPDELPLHPCVRLVAEQEVEAAIVKLMKKQASKT
ncbi:MAG: glycosyltransferase family 9 protein [Ktedonobacteraceae bacterium]